MAKTEKKLNTAVNTEIEQALAAINFTEFTKIDRPKNDKATTKIFGLIFLLVLLLSGVAYYLREGSSLAKYLPADTKFYASLSLPPEKKWFSPLLFWQSDNKPSAAVSRLYEKIDLLSWPGANWPTNILPLLSGRLEIAILPAPDPGEGNTSLVMRSGLADRAAWLSLFSLQSEYKDEVLTRDLAVSGAWGALTKNPNKIAWRILGNDLYLADNADILKQLPIKPANSLSKELQRLKAKPGLGLIYVQDKDALALDNYYIKSLAASSVYPLAISFKQASQAINFNVYSQKSNSPTVKSTALAAKIYNFDNAFYAQNLASAYAQAEASLPNDLINNFWPILKDFYGVDKAEALTEFGTSEIFLTFSGSDWLLNIANNKEENNNLLAILKKAGQALFAITHPQAIEQKLGDGTKLIELRAESAGLEWGEEPWSYASQSISLQSLRGQGEQNGYYAGFVPGLGYILTTSMPLLNQYAASSPAIAAGIKETGCVVSKNMLLAAAISVNNLTPDAFWPGVARKIIITVPQADKISGCVLLLD